VKWSVFFGDAIPRSTVASIARWGHEATSINSDSMNPRYRRMVIPGALVALILLVVVSALVRG
jgi:hypothetical protein